MNTTHTQRHRQRCSHNIHTSRSLEKATWPFSAEQLNITICCLMGEKFHTHSTHTKMTQSNLSKTFHPVEGSLLFVGFPFKFGHLSNENALVTFDQKFAHRRSASIIDGVCVGETLWQNLKNWKLCIVLSQAFVTNLTLQHRQSTNGVSANRINLNSMCDWLHNSELLGEKW